ncbi:MAG TPA: endolytic transglycosylase MltG [Stellaceae bacterium]|nr:endolytic transglycosylase MltG [Stellaceae bacterium]
MRWLRYGVLGLVAVLAVLAGALGWGIGDYFNAGPLNQPTTVVIAKGDSIAQIAATLAAAGIIAHPRAFEVAANLTGAAPGLKAGEYEFPPGISPRFVIELLLSGRVVRHKLTLPEGLTSAEVVGLLNAAPALEGRVEIPPPEGTLLPETYFYLWGERRQELIVRMTRAMDEALAKAWAARVPGLPLANSQQALILASIVEKETARKDERPRIAGVYIRRLRLSMRLQADPTLIYGLTQGGRVPLGHALGHADVIVDSPYNTYFFTGLPPTPIANPGVAAINAVLHPDDRGELYFVADGTGGHAFAKTLAEHNHNVARLRALSPPKAAGAAD